VVTRLETVGLVIRTFEPGDAEAWIDLFSDPEVRHFLPPGTPATRETVQGAIESRDAMERDGIRGMGYRSQSDGRVPRAVRSSPGGDDGSNAGPEMDLACHLIPDS
jgi:RimJ/RimL family protein N-acetyltransferase